MDSRVTALTPRPDPPSPPRRTGSIWVGAFLVAAGIAFGYLLGQASTSSNSAVDTRSAGPVDSTEVEAAPVPSTPVEPAPVAVPEPAAEDASRSPGAIPGSVELQRRLMMWPEDGDPIEILLDPDLEAAAPDAAQSRVAVMRREPGGDGLALHVGKLGDLRFVTAGVTSFAWHPTEAGTIAWVAETENGFSLVQATVSDGLVMATQVAAMRARVRLMAWGSWGFALQSDLGLTTMDRSGELLAHGDVRFVAAGSDGRLLVARPDVPSSTDWAITQADLADQQALNRFDEPEEHPAAAAILPESGRIVLVSNRFGDETGIARIEILDPDGMRQAVIRSGMIAESIAWSPDEERLAVAGHYDDSDQLRSVVLLAASDGAGHAVEVPLETTMGSLGIRE